MSCGELFPCSYYNIFLKIWRSGTVKAANGAAVLPIVPVCTDVTGAVEVEVVGVVGVRVWSRRPVVAVVTGVVEQIGILVDDAAHQTKRL